MIRFDDVVFRYPYDSFDVLKGATFCLESGVNTVLCDLQSGKTTICRLILGELQPTSGKISVFGNSPDEKNPAKNILYLPQKSVFFRNRSVLYNLQYPSRVRKCLKQNEKNIVSVAEKCRLGDKLKCRVSQLSTEQQKMLAVARGLTIPRHTVLFDGFFDDGVLQMSEVAEMFSQAEVKAVFTAKTNLATGRTVLMDGGRCVFQGDGATGKTTADTLVWLANKM